MIQGWEKKVIRGDIQKFNVPSGWPFEPGDYKVGNPYHPAAVVVPLGSPRLESKALEYGCAIVGRCRTANIGIEKLVCNVVSNPNIRWLVVVGPESEGHLSGQAIISLIERGVHPDTKKIIGAKGPSARIPNIPIEIVERFRRQVRVVDMLGVLDEDLLKAVLRGVVQEPWNKVEVKVKGKKYVLYDPGAYLDEPPIIVSLEKLFSVKGVRVESTSYTQTTIIARSIGEAYPYIVWLLDHGSFVEYVDERGSRVRELLNILIHVRKPLAEPMVPREYNILSRSELEEYAKTYLNPSRRGFEYTYGERIVAYPTRVNQLEYVVKKLSNNYNTRRAVIVTWYPPKDTVVDEVPCLTTIMFNCRNGVLHETAVLRSNDMIRAWPANAYALAKLLKYVSLKIGVEPGTLTTLSISGHKYL